jgi:hypothetical protein
MVVDVDSDGGRPEPPASAGTASAEAAFLWELRKYVLLLGTLAASVTYSAGLSPPGGFWQVNAGGRLAGDPVLQETYARRYKVFFYCNARRPRCRSRDQVLRPADRHDPRSVWVDRGVRCRQASASVYISLLVVPLRRHPCSGGVRVTSLPDMENTGERKDMEL